ncbi:hypothetical protein Tco_0692953, partial [Tanacetum coccineum]
MTARFATTQAKILEAHSEAFKDVNTPAKMLQGLDKQFIRKEDGGLYFVERIWMSAYDNLRTLIMNEAHAVKYYVHPGADKITSSGHDAIWVIVDRLTKSAHFLAIREDYKTERLARLYINEIIARH